MPYAPTPLPLKLQLFLDFPVFSVNVFAEVALQKFVAPRSCGNLAVSPYPHRD